MFPSSRSAICVLARTSIRNVVVPPVVKITKRTVRNKANFYPRDWLGQSIHRDERLLKKLNKRVAGLEKQIEEDEAKGGMFRPWDPNDDGAMMPNDNEWLWNKVLSPGDRLFLGANKINSVEELMMAEQQAQDALSQSKPLSKRLETVHDIYATIMPKIAKAQLDSSKYAERHTIKSEDL